MSRIAPIVSSAVVGMILGVVVAAMCAAASDD